MGGVLSDHDCRAGYLHDRGGMMLLTLLSALGGGLMRLLPEVLQLFNKRTDNSHELAMMDKQIQLEQLQAEGKQRQVEYQGAVDQNLALWATQKAALEGQMQKVGIWWVDAMNFLVRSITTYYFLGCYGIVKTAMIIVACRSANAWDAIIKCWSADDAAVLSMILAFWFVGRAVDTAKGQK